MLNLYRRITNRKTGQEHFLTENACKVLFGSNQRQASEYAEDRTAYYQNVKGKYVRVEFPKNETQNNSTKSAQTESTTSFNIDNKSVSTKSSVVDKSLQVPATPVSDSKSIVDNTILSKKSVVVSGPDDDLDTLNGYNDFSLDAEEADFKPKKMEKAKSK